MDFVRAFFCCNCCCDAADDEDSYVRPTSKRFIEEHFLSEICDLAERSKKSQYKALNQNRQQLEYRKRQLVDHLKTNWEDFLARFGDFRPIIDFFVCQKLQALDDVSKIGALAAEGSIFVYSQAKNYQQQQMLLLRESKTTPALRRTMTVRDKNPLKLNILDEGV